METTIYQQFNKNGLFVCQSCGHQLKNKDIRNFCPECGKRINSLKFNFNEKTINKPVVNLP